MEENDYSPEQKDQDFYDDLTLYNVAGKGRRFANHIIDVLGMYILAFLIGCTSLFIEMLLDVDSTSWLDNLDKGGEWVLGLAILLSYYLFFEGIFHITPGKLVTRTIIVTKDGYKPSFSDILFRTLWRIVPFEAFSFLGEEGIGWHDSQTKTRVVDKRSYIAPKNGHKSI